MDQQIETEIFSDCLKNYIEMAKKKVGEGSGVEEVLDSFMVFQYNFNTTEERQFDEVFRELTGQFFQIKSQFCIQRIYEVFKLSNHMLNKTIFKISKIKSENFVTICEEIL